MDSVFLSLLGMSFTASIVIIAVLAIRLLLKKTPKIFSYAIWAVVLFRLLCPFSFESAIGLIPSNEPIPQNIVYEAQPEIDTGFEIIDNSVNEILPPATPMASVNPIQIWILIGRIIWSVGIFALVLYAVIQYALLKRKLIGSKPLCDNIYLADGINSPFVMGLFKPKIYLPSSLPKNEYDFIIAHEKCHIKRLDHITRVLSFIALALHWFNPLVWVAYIVSAKDMEMSCDEAVMKNMNSDIRAEYSTSLLRLATGKKLIFATPLAFGEGDTKSRVKNVMKYKKPVVWVGIIIATLVLGIIFALGTNRVNENLRLAQNLSIDDIEKIEFVSYPSHLEDSYALISEFGYGDIVNLINQSSGTQVQNSEKHYGGGEYFYITTKDGNVLTVGNLGNLYLEINDDFFEADYDWLIKFSSFKGNEPLPDDFHSGKMLETTAFAEFPNGVYTLESDSFIKLIIKDDTFQFHFDPLSSYFPHGYYIVEDDLLIATTTNEENTYNFRIDNGDLIFVKTSSSSTSVIDTNLVSPVVDGSVFTLSETEPLEDNYIEVVDFLPFDNIIEITLSDTIEVSNFALGIYSAYIENELSQIYQNSKLVDYGSDFEILSAEITNIEHINTGTSNNDHSIDLYRLEYRLTVDNIDNVPLIGGMTTQDGKLTEWNSGGQPYFLFYSDDTEEIFIEHTTTYGDIKDYEDPEYIEQYGNVFTAYAMETYAEYMETIS